jgi:hypothetical protein
MMKSEDLAALPFHFCSRVRAHDYHDRATSKSRAFLHIRPASDTS